MDVQCERCKTEYEFDDALVSGRGTTVRCTNCGHQFKVRRQEPDGSPEEVATDRWQVRTSNGQLFTFLTLRELQRAILAGQVSRADQLRRGGAPSRLLGSISELEPFFQGQTSSNRPPPPAAEADGSLPSAFPKRSSVAFDGAAASRAPPQRTEDSSFEPPPLPRRKIETLRPPASAAAAPPQAALPAPVTVPPPTPAPPPADGAPRMPVMGHTQVLPAMMAPPPVAASLPSALPPATRPVRRTPSSSDETEALASMPPSADEPFSVPGSRRVGGWIVAFVLMLAVGVVGWAVAKPYLLARRAPAGAPLDPRVPSFLDEGEKAMADGDLDSAQQAIDKASALAESDPRVLLDEARVAAAQADVPWLKLRLLPPEAADELRTTKAQLDERVVRARRSADAAAAAATDDPSAIRARIDALRLSGDLQSARGYVSRVIAQASQPETAYVLAALDLAEPEPLWKTVIERLRLAAAGEGNGGRARAALVYALARSGDMSGAKAELAKLEASTRPYPLLPSLHALVGKPVSKAVAAGSTPSAGASRTAATSPLAASPAGGPAPSTAAAGGGGEAISADPRVAMQQAVTAVRIGQLARARQIYESIVARNPSDSEALAGLGDVARLQGDPQLAISRYRRAIAVNPSYLPALMGLADTQWDSGDKASALRGYTAIVDRFPEGTYPPRVKQRSEAAIPAPASPPAKSSAAASTGGSTE